MTNYTMPTSPRIQSVVFRMASRNAISTSPFTFQQQVIAHQGQRWEVDVSLPPMRRDQAAAWLAWLAKLDGTLHTFNVGDPMNASPQGSAGGTPLVAGASQTGASINIDGCATSQTGWLKAGDYIQLGAAADARLYMVTDDVDTNASGEATVNIWPQIRTAPSDNASVIVSNTVGTFRLSSDASTWSFDNAKIYGIQFSGVGVV